MKYLLQSDICHSNSFYLNFYFQKLKSINNWRSNGMKKKIPLQILSLIHKIKSVSKVIKAFCSTTKIPFVTSFPYKQPPPPLLQREMQKEGRVTERNGISKEGTGGSISDKAYNAMRDALLDLCACQSLGMHTRDCTLHTCNAREMENSDGVP